jgi:16S rRNA processing protein RimM
VSGRVVAARLVGTFGVRGELKCAPSGAGEAAMVPGARFALGDADGAESVTLATVRRHQGRLLVALEGASTLETAEAFAGRVLYMDRSAVALDEGEYLDEDLVGLRLLDENGAELGVVSAIEHYPAQDCLVVGPARALIPLVRAFVRSVDLETGVIVVSLPPGLLDATAAEEA